MAYGKGRYSGRLNDTGAIAGQPSRGGENHSVNSREIGNGYVVCEYSTDPHTGEMKSTETFYKNPPKIVPARVTRGEAGEGPGSLEDAMNYLKKD